MLVEHVRAPNVAARDRHDVNVFRRPSMRRGSKGGLKAKAPPRVEESAPLEARNTRQQGKGANVLRCETLADRLRVEFKPSCEVVALIHTEMQRNRVRFQSRFVDDLPLVFPDRVQLQQVMINLIVNAIEAMSGTSDRPRELTIVSGIDDPNDVFAEVHDTGPGLDPEQFDRLFQSFYTTKPEGIGMGLAISRSIVDAHGGRLSAAPNKPHGALFRFTLPVATTSPV